MSRIDPITRRPWPKPVDRVPRVERRDPRDERGQADPPPPRRDRPGEQPPDDGRPHVDVHA